MTELIFSSHNPNKVKEAKLILPGNFKVLSLTEIGWNTEIPETGTTLEENSAIKVQTLYTALQKSCFADDTGLEVQALNGAPGVYSARYAGEKATDADNRAKLLMALKGETNRSAQFTTVISFIDKNGALHQFKGEVKGTINTEEKGKEGFGYDALFVPEGYDITFAEMSAAEKNGISHRKRALEKFCNFLSN